MEIPVGQSRIPACYDLMFSTIANSSPVITSLNANDNYKAFLFERQIKQYGHRGSRPGYLLIENIRVNFEEIIMKKLVIAVAAVAMLSGPVYAKDSMHNQMVKMMQMMKEMKARNIQLERILQNMMGNLSSSHHG